MNKTNHRAVLHALLLCSRRFSTATISDNQDGTQHSWPLDETGTINTSGLTFYSENDAEQQEIREALNIPVPDEVLQVHGYAHQQKRKEQSALYMRTLTGSVTRCVITRNWKG
jgi:hypothetical protein